MEISQAGQRITITEVSQFERYLYGGDDTIREVIIDIHNVCIPDFMFFNAQKLESVTFCQDVALVGAWSFFGCEKLKKVTFKKAVRRIAMKAFADAPITKVTFHNDVQIEGRAFYKCGNYGERLHFEVDCSLPAASQLRAFAQKAGIALVLKERREPSKIAQSKHPLTLRAENFGVKINGRQILKDIDLEIGPGEMIMILGGAGTGKSTLMKNLFGVDPYSTGTVTANIGKTKKTGAPTSEGVKSLLGSKVYYAPQFLTVNEELTVKQVIQRYAKLYKGCDYKKEELKELAKKYSLWDDNQKLLNTLAKKISGGQQKKLMLACSQTIDAQVLLFDEPDSGLDEPNAYRTFIQDIRENEVNQKGKTAIIVSHHPRDIMNDYQHDNARIPFDRIFTRLIVLGKMEKGQGATIVFSGTPRDAKRFFEIENDPYSRIVSLVTPWNEGGECQPGQIERYIRKYKRWKG